MSTTSTTTTLAAWDHIPSDIADLSNCMCLFALANDDCTLFDASSILEEDIIEICIQFGHTHPERVLWYSAVELVILFHTVGELQVMMCRVVKALMLHEEAIRVRTSPPAATHVRAYMAAVTGEPSGIQPPPSSGEEEPHLSPSNPTQVGEPHNTSRQMLGISWIMSWQQLMEELCREIVLWELNTHPRNPPQTPWGNPMGNGDPDVDDQEVTFLRGGGWVPLEQPFWPPTHAQPDGGWVPRGQPPCPPAPVQPWGTMSKGPLPGVSSVKEHHTFSQRDSSRYGQIYGLYC